MKKFLILFVPLISLANEVRIQEVFFNGRKDSLEVKLNSNLKSNTPLDINEIDNLVDNFKFAKNNNVKVNIEPSTNDGMVNVVIENQKTNPLSLSIGMDNHGENEDTGIYRYKVNAGLSGLILNENLNISYTFVKPINPKRRQTIDLKPGEIVTPPKEEERQKARKNNSLNVELSFPIKTYKIYFDYANSNYKRSILANNDIYDVSGNSNKFSFRLKKQIYRNKENKLNVLAKYSYTNRKSYIEDVLLENENLNDISLGLEYENKALFAKSMYSYNIENKINSIDNELSIKKDITKDLKAELEIKNHLEKENNSLDLKLKANYKILYTHLGFETDFNKINPCLKMGLKGNVKKLDYDLSLQYKEKLKLLFDVNINII